MSKNSSGFSFTKETAIIIAGFALEAVTSFVDMPDGIVRKVLIIGGLLLIFTGMIMVRLNNPYSDSTGSLVADDVRFDFEGHFNEYRNVLSRKKGSIKYSTWRNDILKKYRKFGDESDTKKKAISQDVRFYLKESRRKSAEKVETVKTILIPAEFGIVASLYELDISYLSGEMRLFLVILLSIVLCTVCSVEINTGNKVIKFIDDFSEILEIPIE